MSVQDVRGFKLDIDAASLPEKGISNAKIITILALAAIGATAVAAGITLVLTSPGMVLIGGAAIAVGSVVVVSTAIMIHWKELIYKISLAQLIIYNKIDWHPWFNTILEDRLTLGSIPLKSQFKAICDHGVDAVLMLLEPFEYETNTFFSQPVTEEEFQKARITRKIIHTPDFDPVGIEQIKAGVAFIKEQIDAGKHVYVDCKAGRGRSATILICYLIQYTTYKSFQAAFDLVKEKRPRINLNSRQKQAVLDYVEHITQLSRSEKEEQPQGALQESLPK